MPKTLPVRVYHDDAGDCSNGGVTSQCKRLYLICENGWWEEPEDSDSLLRLVSRKLFRDRTTYLHAEPVNPGDLSDKVGPMFGGAFIWSSDSRFPSDYPIPVHDRFEEVELYDRLSL